jgi:gliding motility-associated protein GldC
MSKSSEIRIQVELDDNHVPEQISWDAPDGGVEGESADALFLSVWNKSNQDTLRIDLWTKELPLDDMKKFVHQSVLSMADTMERATSQEKLAMEMRKFARYLGEEMELIQRRENDPQAPDSNGG